MLSKWVANGYYEKGSIVEYEGTLYKAILTISDGTFNSAHWTTVSSIGAPQNYPGPDITYDQ